MPTYDYKAALEVLTETEKNRIVCLYLSSDTAAIGSSVSISLSCHDGHTQAISYPG